MTISYNLDISTANVFAFVKLLFRWKASIWKAVLKELLIWTICYLIVAYCYKSSWLMSERTRSMFERTAMYFGNYLNDNNLMFILGFFLTCVATRWDVLLRNIGFIESLALFVSACVRGEDDESRMYRRTIVRHACLAQCLVLRDISVRVRRRFPTMESLIDAGFLTKKELDKFNSYKTSYDKFWVPISWSLTNVMNARRTEKVRNDMEANALADARITYSDIFHKQLAY